MLKWSSKNITFIFFFYSEIIWVAIFRPKYFTELFIIQNVHVHAGEGNERHNDDDEGLKLVNTNTLREEKKNKKMKKMQVMSRMGARPGRQAKAMSTESKV